METRDRGQKLSTSGARANLPPASQSVVQPLTRAAIFLVATIGEGPQSTSAVRDFCADLPALVRSVGFRDIEANLSCIMGIGSNA
jgi:putative iron-dependent peroxidase